MTKKGNYILRKIKRIFFIMICFCLLIGSAAELLPKARAASEMAASDACVEFIKKVEGFSAEPYYDYNQYTVGYGTKCPSDKYFTYKSSGIPRSEAEALLREALAEIEDTLNTKLLDKHNLTFTQNQFDALVSFSFNIGSGWVTYDSSLRNAILRNADADDLTYAFGLYCTAGGKYLPGLVTRRLCEANMYLNGSYSNQLSNDFGYVYYDANGGTVTYRVQGYLSGNKTAPAADATRNSDVFLGWFTELNGGSQVTVLDGSLTGRTLFAHWQSAENTEPQNTVSTTIRVTGDGVNIRSGPGTNYGIVKQVYRNEVLTVTHVTHLTNMKWGKVQNGWICLDFTNYDAVVNGTGNTDTETNHTPPADTTIPENNTADTETDNTNTPSTQTVISGIVNVNDVLNIRSGPGTTYSTVGFLFRNTKVSILEQRAAGTSVWGRIEKGWVCMDYIITDALSSGNTVTPNPEPNPEQETVPKQETTPEQQPSGSVGQTEATAISGKITADVLRIRSGAGTNHPIVGFYYQNDSVTVSEKVLVGSVYWGKTSKGWISMEYVKANTSATIEPMQPTQPTQPMQPSSGDGKTVIGDCLRIRKEAGTEHKIVGFLYYGDKVTILETKDVNGTPWGRVDKGWICMQYVQ